MTLRILMLTMLALSSTQSVAAIKKYSGVFTVHDEIALGVFAPYKGATGSFFYVIDDSSVIDSDPVVVSGTFSSAVIYSGFSFGDQVFSDTNPVDAIINHEPGLFYAEHTSNPVSSTSLSNVSFTTKNYYDPSAYTSHLFAKAFGIGKFSAFNLFALQTGMLTEVVARTDDSDDLLYGVGTLTDISTYIDLPEPSPISPVPVPAAAFVFAPALLGFAALRRKNMLT